MATSPECPGRFPVAIDGRPYMIDPSQYERASIPVMREQADTTSELGEQSLNRRGLWWRSQDSWHHGAGQEVYDGKISGTSTDSERFHHSTGADPWTRGQVSNLPKFTRIHTSGTHVIAVGNHAYIIDGQQVRFASAPTTGTVWSSSDIQAGQAAQTVQSIATNGNYVWAALGTSGLHRTAKTATSSTADSPAAPGGGNIGLVGFALGRLLVAGSDTHTSRRNVLWEVLDPLGTPSLATGINGLKFVHPDPAFVWLGIAPGRNAVYAWGMIPAGPVNLNLGLEYGGQAEVYRIVQNPTDTSLNPPILASYLPDGESLHTMTFYAGGVTMGTSRGIRVAAVDGPGNLDYGPLIKTPHPVTAIEPQDRFVWFGMPQQTSPDGTSTRRGLGRVDLGYFTDTLTPAWSQDVAAVVPDIGNITSIAAVAGFGFDLRMLYFAVDSGGFSTDPRGIYAIELSGGLPVYDTLDTETGLITYSTSEAKTLYGVEVRHTPLPAGTLSVYYRTNGDTAWTSAGSNAVDGTVVTVVPIGGTDGLTGVETAELRFQYVPAASETTQFSILRWTLRSLPTPTRNAAYLLPIIMSRKVWTLLDDSHPMDVGAEIAFLEALEEDGTIVEFQVGQRNLVGYVEDTQFKGEKWSPTPDREAEGILMVRMVTLG